MVNLRWGNTGNSSQNNSKTTQWYSQVHSFTSKLKQSLPGDSSHIGRASRHYESSCVSPCGTSGWTSSHTHHSEKAFHLNQNARNGKKEKEQMTHLRLQWQIKSSYTLIAFILHSPVWIFSCLWRRYFWMKRISHWLHWNGFSPGVSMIYRNIIIWITTIITINMISNFKAKWN